MKTPKVVGIDFETEAIRNRPAYPPKPVSVSIQMPGERKPKFYAWGHHSGNNAEEWAVAERLKDVVRSGSSMVFQNGKFDVDVMETHLKVPAPSWDKIHDSMYLIFLHDPHAPNLSLKPSSERILGMAPEERDRVKEWVLAHKSELERKFGAFSPKEWGAFISEAPGELVGPYCNSDVDRTIKLFNHLFPLIDRDGMLAAYDRERELMPILLANERLGIRIDMPKLERDIVTYTAARDKVDSWLRKRLKAPGLDFNKDAAVAKALKNSGVVTDFIKTPTGKDSVSKKNLTPDMFSDSTVASALGYRNRLTTCLGTFMEPWFELGIPGDGIIHTSWNQVRTTDRSDRGARTGRMSSRSPNFMNVPTSWDDKDDWYAHPTELGVPELPFIREYVMSRQKGHVFAGRDYDQQELRILAHYEDGDLMEAYAENPKLDVHTYVQQGVTSILGRDVQRKAVKIMNFGGIYGMGLGKLAQSMGVDINTAKELNAARKSAIPGLKQLEKEIKEAARTDQPIVTWGGRQYFKEPSVIINGRKVDFGYKLLNYLIQGSAADCTKQAIINYSKVRKDGEFYVTVHDELNVSCPRKAVKEEMRVLGKAMADVKFDVPMLSTPYYGSNWHAVKKFKEKPYEAV